MLTIKSLWNVIHVKGRIRRFCFKFPGGGCRHFFAEAYQRVAMQLYLALIASLLFQHYICG